MPDGARGNEWRQRGHARNDRADEGNDGRAGGDGKEGAE